MTLLALTAVCSMILVTLNFMISRLTSSTQGRQVLLPLTCKCYLIRRRNSSRCNSLKDFKRRRSRALNTATASLGEEGFAHTEQSGEDGAEGMMLLP